MNNKAAISSLAMDLKRIALASHRGTSKTAQRFIMETKRWKAEIDPTLLPPYVKKILQDVDESLHNHDTTRIAEDALMYSTLLQNYALLI